MSEVPESPDTPKKPDRQSQFSLASVMILMTAFCVWCAVEGRSIYSQSKTDGVVDVRIGIFHFAYPEGGAAGVVSAGIAFIFVATVAIGRWKIFEKAGQPPWGALIPIYSLYLLLRIAERPTWWLILYLIPFINLLPLVLVPLDVARHFGKGILFGWGLIIFGFIFYPILGFGLAQYCKPTYVRYHDGQPYVC